MAMYHSIIFGVLKSRRQRGIISCEKPCLWLVDEYFDVETAHKTLDVLSDDEK